MDNKNEFNNLNKNQIINVENKCNLNERDKISNFRKILNPLIAGSIAGALAKTIIAPLDRLKINFQIENKHFDFKESIKFLSTSYKNNGIIDLWRGNSATMARIIPFAAFQYCAHEHLKIYFELDSVEKKKFHPFKNLLAGCLAGIISTIATYPLDLARARMAVTQKDDNKSIRSVFKIIIKKQGVLGLYKGGFATILGVIPYAGTSFFTYETLKIMHYEYYSKNQEINPLERLFFGALAGLFGQSSSYPLDIVRRRMQIKKNYNSIYFTIKKVVSEEGIIHGLYKGLSLNWIKGPIAVGVSFTTFDIINKFLNENYF